MIKKILFIITLLSFMSAPVTAMAFPESHMIAQVSLDPNLKPQYAPSITISPDANQKGGVANMFLQMIAGSLILLAGPTGILILAIGGLKYVTSHGNQTAMESAKKTINFAIIGLIIIALSYAIVTNIIKLLIK